MRDTTNKESIQPTTAFSGQILLSFFVLLIFSGQILADWNHENVIGAAECGECHEEAVSIWKKTAHQKNFKAISKNKDAKKIAKKMGVKKIKKDTALCASCHYTVGTKRGKARVTAGVSCESCHAPAKDWVDIHNDYGGKGITVKTETAAHKKQRLLKLDTLGMVTPENTYGWVKNCLDCHIVTDEKLVNVGGHSSGGDFDISKRTQGEILHTDKASADELQHYRLVSYSTELEVIFRALASAKGGEYAASLVENANAALSNLKKANATAGDADADKIVALAGKARIATGNKSLKSTADSISKNIKNMVNNETGYEYH